MEYLCPQCKCTMNSIGKAFVFVLSFAVCFGLILIAKMSAWERKMTKFVDLNTTSTLVYIRSSGNNSMQNFHVQMLPNMEELLNTTKYAVTVNETYFLENPALCSSVKNLTVIVTVNSAPDHFERRQAMRQTWTNDRFYTALGISLRPVFLLGTVHNSSLQKKIKEEFLQHGDIVQGKFVDAYYNMTHKGVMGYKWLTGRCRNAKFVIKTDDDILVNIYKLFLDHFKQNSLNNVHVYCERKAGSIFRSPKNKWYVSESMFKGKKQYLPFCKGKFVWIRNDVIPTLFEAAAKTPFFHLDDVLLYGYVMHQVEGLQYQSTKNTEWETRAKVIRNCLTTKKRSCDKLLMDTRTPKDMIDFWNIISQMY